MLRRLAVDNQLSAVILIQSANDIQQRCFARPALAQNRDKLTFPEIQIHLIQCHLSEVSGLIAFGDVF
ncbi:hypothetical protein D3C79_1107880 [compost metagenome]